MTARKLFRHNFFPQPFYLSHNLRYSQSVRCWLKERTINYSLEQRRRQTLYFCINIDYSEHKLQIMVKQSLLVGVHKIFSQRKPNPWRFEGDIFNERDEGKSLEVPAQ